jgi:hypothetical protein
MNPLALQIIIHVVSLVAVICLWEGAKRAFFGGKSL